MARSIPAAPGATPRKILPPPITTAISSPSAATWPISPTMRSMVARLIPKGSSPMRASPLSLSRMRLYLAVAVISLGRLAVSLLFNSLADYVQHETRDRRTGSLEESFHGLLSCRILDVNFTEQCYVLEKFLHASLYHLFLDVGSLAQQIGRDVGAR